MRATTKTNKKKRGWGDRYAFLYKNKNYLRRDCDVLAASNIALDPGAIDKFR